MRTWTWRWKRSLAPGLRLGGRALHGYFRGCPRRRGHGQRIGQAPRAAGGGAQGRHIERSRRGLRTDGGRARQSSVRMDYIAIGENGRVPGCWWTGRGYKLQGYEGRIFSRRQPVRPRDAGQCASTRRRFSARCFPLPVRRTMRTRCGFGNEHEYGNGVAIFTRDGDAARGFRRGVSRWVWWA